MSEGGGWSELFWNNHDQPRAINRFIDVKNFRNEGATMLAAAIHLLVVHHIFTWAKKLVCSIQIMTPWLIMLMLNV